MKNYFRSLRFKILVGIALVMVGFMLYASTNEGYASLPSQIVGAILSPFQKASSYISGAAGDFFNNFFNAANIAKENDVLKDENSDLKKQLIDYNEVLRQNQQYESLLGIVQTNPDIKLQPAFVIGRDPDSDFYSFTIDRGSESGIKLNDPVITSEGVVGIISNVSLYSSEVTTVLDVSFNMGCLIVETRDTGIVTGDISLAGDGLCKMSYIPIDSTAAAGSLVMTSGSGGVFPKNLIVGTLQEVKTETHGKSLYAVIKPAVSVKSVKDVFIITSFEGQVSH